MTALVRRLPSTRLVRWATRAVVALFAVAAAVQPARQSPLVTGCALAVTVAATLPIAPGRRGMLALFAVSGAGVVVLGNNTPSKVGFFTLCVLVGWCAFVGTTRATVALWAAVVVTLAVEWAVTVGDAGWGAWIAGTTFSAFGCLLARREQDLVKRLRIAQEGLADRVRAEERDRIARELHDVIAHSLTVSLLHVSSARLALDEDPEEAERAMREAERLGRDCLTEVRQVVGLLRHDEGGAMAPLPGAAQLSTLVDQFRRAGADVAFATDGDLSALPNTLGLALYRILQEALTNAARHAPAAPTAALLAVTSTGAVLVVDTAGVGASVVGAGSGLLSMRERAQMLGGTCVAGPIDGGWQVRAELPLRAGNRP
jgi:signal transduction histidine kinase